MFHSGRIVEGICENMCGSIAAELGFVSLAAAEARNSEEAPGGVGVV